MRRVAPCLCFADVLDVLPHALDRDHRRFAALLSYFLPRPMFAFQPSLPLSRRPANTPKFSSRSPLRATAAAPNTATAQLRAYEAFLRSSPPPQTPDAPVYQTADGALVCEWHPNKAHVRRAALSALLKLDEYEKFLATSEAAGVDITRPVYVNCDGNLVCHYP